MKTLRAAAICLALAATGQAYAFDLDPSEIRGKSSKEPVTVLQNRYFLKAYRPEFGLMTGFLMDQAYLNTTLVGARAGLFVNEWLGFEVSEITCKNSDSDDRKALNGMQYSPLNGSGNATPKSTTTSGGTTTTTQTVVHPDPEVDAIRSITDFDAVAAPLYGKLNVLNKWIVYTDLYLTGGVSQLVTDQGDKTGLIMGVGERFYVGKAWSMRVDFKDRMFDEERGGQQSKRHSKGLDFGASYFFN